MSRASTPDAVKLELYKNLFASVAEEMGGTLGRTAFSPNIKERRDYSCALFGAEGQMVAQAAHIPVHLGSMPLSVQAAIEQVPMHPGDMVILNDPFCGGTHLPDVTLVAPVFVGDTLAFFVANRAHHADIGGMSAGSMPLSRSVIQEGLRIPPIKLYAEGHLREDVLSLILSNVRTPEERRGDLEAQIAANSVGTQRLQGLVAKYGLPEVQEYMMALHAYTANMVRDAIKKIPDGTYRFCDQMDDDGVSGEPVPICVSLSVTDDHATVDFSGSAPQVLGSINAVYAITVSAVFYVFRCLVGSNIPSNAGCLEPIALIAPEKSVVNAVFPAAVAGGNVETSQRIVDVLLGALSQACPDKIPAASCGSMNNLTIGGEDPFRGRTFAYYETTGGGMGACATHSGQDAVHTHMTNTANTPVEALETTYPFRVEEYSIRHGSGGVGQFHGGAGIVRRLRALCPVEVNILSERRRFAPYGLCSGSSGKIGRNMLLRGLQRTELPGKTCLILQTGEGIQIETPGGGGYGEER